MTRDTHAAANALALQHRDIAATVVANISRRTGHPRDDLEQIAMLGILQAARRYSPQRGAFRPFARPRPFQRCKTRGPIALIRG